jgi:biopolymer transport protein ExbD
MRLRVKPSRRRLDRITINLASMIDVSFLLLFYFMVGTILDDREKRLSTALQTQSSNTQNTSDLQSQSIEVRRIDSQPSYRLGARTMHDKTELAAALAPLPKSAGIFVRVFDDVEVGFAVAAVQVARDAGFEQVTYVPAK